MFTYSVATKNYDHMKIIAGFSNVLKHVWDNCSVAQLNTYIYVVDIRSDCFQVSMWFKWTCVFKETLKLCRLYLI